MAKQTRLDLLLGTDYQLRFPVLTAAETAAIDASAWTLSFMVKRSKSDLDDAAEVTKTTGAGIAVSGSFNADPAANAQRVVVTLEDSDTDALASGRAFWELKRVDPGLETILAYGEVRLQRTVHRA